MRWPERTIAERFWSKANKTETCWLWTGFTVRGYGRFAVSTKRPAEKAHRFAWELTHGPVPAGMHVLHRCDVPGCVRPSHLFLGTHADNMADAKQKGRWPRGENHWRAKQRRARLEREHNGTGTEG